MPDYFRSLQRKKLEETVDTYYCDDSFDFTGIVNKIGRDMVKHRIRAIISLLISLLLSFFSARMFLKMRQAESIVPGEGVSHVGLLSDYFPGIKNTRGDTEVFILEGDFPGGAAVILGGTHPNEPAGFVTAVCLIENMKIAHGRLIIIPRANNSGFTHSDPQEGTPQIFVIETKHGERWFRYGSRSTNPIDQWPDPEVYQHYPSKQKLSGTETRNLNRAYPGRPNGSLTEKVAYAIMQLMEKEHVDLALDLHEASPEYPVINALVTHPLAVELAGEAVMALQLEDLNFSLEPSPENFRGLSHREWGDHLKIPAILMESANVMQGRYHGRVSQDVIITGKDRFNYEAAHHGLLEVEYPEEGIPLKRRVGRHLLGIQTIFQIWSEKYPQQAIVIEDVPDFTELQEKGIGAFLK